MDIRGMMELYRQDDEVYTLLFPVCALADLDIDEVVDGCRDIALRTEQTQMSVAVQRRYDILKTLKK